MRNKILVHASLLLMALSLGCSDGGGNGLGIDSSAETTVLDFSRVYYRVYADSEPLSEEFVKASTYPYVAVNNATFKDLPALSTFSVRFYYSIDESEQCIDCECINGRFCQYARLAGTLRSTGLNEDLILDPLDLVYDCVPRSTNPCNYVVHLLEKDDGTNVEDPITVARNFNSDITILIKYHEATQSRLMSSNNGPVTMLSPNWPGDQAGGDPPRTNWANSTDRWYVIDAAPSSCSIDASEIKAIEMFHSSVSFPHSVLLYFNANAGMLAEIPISSTDQTSNYPRYFAEMKNGEGAILTEGNFQYFLVRDATVGWARVYKDANDVGLPIDNLDDSRYCNINLTTKSI